MAIGLRAGRLRHRIEIQQKTESRSALGDYIESWTSLTTVWGSVEPFQGNEQLLADQIDSRVTHRIILRYRNGIGDTAKFRFRNDGNIFNPINIINKEYRDWQLEILAELSDTTDDLLLESGEYLLLESEGKLVLE